jgi:NitT/TauT family transport system substrate-binding protein
LAEPTANNGGDQSPLVCFGEVVSRDPFFLIGNSKRFKLSDLAHLRFAAVSEVPTPWMCLQHDLREAGVDPAMITRISDRTMPDNYAALRGGQLDVMQAFEPFASQAEIDRAGEILYAASSRGPTVYTAFIATRSKVAVHHDAFVAVTQALAKMQQWLYAHSGKELAEVIASFFPMYRRNYSFVLCNAISMLAYGRAILPCRNKGLNASDRASFRVAP